MAIRKEKNIIVSVIILNYKTPDLILKLLRKIGENKQLEIVIVDNSPERGLESALKHIKSGQHYFYAGKNLGFAGGNNFGLSHARGEWLFFLNSDTECSADNILSLVEIAEKHRFSLATPKLYGEDSRTQHSIGYFDSFVQNPINYLFARPRYVDPDQISQPTGVDVANGTALLVKREIFKEVGLWDHDHFFMYFDDIDFCYRLWQRHVPILYCPQIIIFHQGGASSDRDPKQKSLNYQTSLSNYMEKHRGPIIKNINGIFRFFS